MEARFQPTWAWYSYRVAAQISAWILSASAVPERILAHRSLGTGEITFARSDTDLIVVLPRGNCSGEALLKLYGALTWARRFNPTLSHVEVFAPEELVRFASIDTVWAALEQHSAWPLVGPDLPLPPVLVKPDDGLRRFILWCELLLGAVLARRRPRNLRKIALECWNFYAVAEGLLPGPFSRRETMASHLCELRGPQLVDTLHRPQACVDFVLGLANELHASRLPSLKTLKVPYVFESLVAPHGMVRQFIVSPKPEWPLPRALPPWPFLVTPELLDLYLHYKNAYFAWSLPRELRDLGLQLPQVSDFVRDARYYLSPQFLRFPGFTDQRPLHPEDRLDCVAYALPYLNSGMLPPPKAGLPRPRLSGRKAILEYFEQDYDRVLEQQHELDRALECLDLST